MGGVCSTYGEKKRLNRVFVVTPVEKRPFGTPRRRREDNIKMDLLEVRCGKWTGLIWLRIRRDVGFL